MDDRRLGYHGLYLDVTKDYTPDSKGRVSIETGMHTRSILAIEAHRGKNDKSIVTFATSTILYSYTLHKWASSTQGQSRTRGIRPGVQSPTQEMVGRMDRELKRLATYGRLRESTAEASQRLLSGLTTTETTQSSVTPSAVPRLDRTGKSGCPFKRVGKVVIRAASARDNIDHIPPCSAQRLHGLASDMILLLARPEALRASNPPISRSLEDVRAERSLLDLDIFEVCRSPHYRRSGNIYCAYIQTPSSRQNRLAGRSSTYGYQGALRLATIDVVRAGLKGALDALIDRAHIVLELSDAPTRSLNSSLGPQTRIVRHHLTNDPSLVIDSSTRNCRTTFWGARPSTVLITALLPSWTIATNVTRPAGPDLKDEQDANRCFTTFFRGRSPERLQTPPNLRDTQAKCSLLSAPNSTSTTALLPRSLERSKFPLPSLATQRPAGLDQRTNKLCGRYQKRLSRRKSLLDDISPPTSTTHTGSALKTALTNRTPAGLDLEDVLAATRAPRDRVESPTIPRTQTPAYVPAGRSLWTTSEATRSLLEVR
ncbi:hypothetical protein B0H17DRAFT_1205212 [Mycena rosella]|uniref:Uncharacterized protein n=1 Tax=Mycena rosella TaxID=1033263 RepID=A0AAD7D803_MYCRO|nr:hypothetical protein B0H17DRAFT_1205212 [Mycena rosella]